MYRVIEVKCSGYTHFVAQRKLWVFWIRLSPCRTNAKDAVFDVLEYKRLKTSNVIWQDDAL